jgi:outer membrane receptor protein involved in Fe transport
VFYTKGKHALKFGVLINRYYEPTVMNKGTQGGDTPTGFAGNSNAGALAGVQGNILFETPYAGAPTINGCSTAACASTLIDRNFVFNTFGFYAQDDYRATSRLTLNLGLRYEFQTVPYDTAGRNSTIPDLLTSSTYRIGPIIANATYRNISPRVGFAWDVFGNGKTAVRSGFGIYYDIANLGSIFTLLPLSPCPRSPRPFIFILTTIHHSKKKPIPTFHL